MKGQAEANRSELLDDFVRVRAATERLAAPLSPEDQLVQSMPSASPTKWHRAHTTWFFETAVLVPHGLAPVKPGHSVLYNSYYESLGPRHPRPARGLLSRPSSDEVTHYRATVNARVVELILGADAPLYERIAPLVRLAIAHEEQHQELLLTDILDAFSKNPLLPAYRGGQPRGAAARNPTKAASVEGQTAPMRFHRFDGGLVDVGAASTAAFAFDNERPRHRRWIEPFELADRLVTVAEVKAFIRDGGYREPLLWLSEGWDLVKEQGFAAPLHARMEGQAFVVFGLDGEREAADHEPAVHVSYYEADAVARFLGARLPTEFEWEVAASAHARSPKDGNFVEGGALRPLPAAASPGGHDGGPQQLFGDAWEWTRSAYEPYPGFAPLPGVLSEYNGKFMVGQVVLRGGSCFTPSGHVTASYRNFWPPATRFQVAGVRLAKDPHPTRK